MLWPGLCSWAFPSSRPPDFPMGQRPVMRPLPCRDPAPMDMAARIDPLIADRAPWLAANDARPAGQPGPQPASGP
jgi:hypothetical protein